MKRLMKTTLIAFGVALLGIATLTIAIAVRQGAARPTHYELPAGYRGLVMIEDGDRECPPLMIKGTSGVIPVTASGDFCASIPDPTRWKDLRYVGHNGQASVVISLAVFTLVIGSFLGIGLILIIGTLMRWEFLIHPPESRLFRYLYNPLHRQFGERGVVCLHLFVGASFVLASIWFVVYVVFLA
jgi:hypothetical protein